VACVVRILPKNQQPLTVPICWMWTWSCLVYDASNGSRKASSHPTVAVPLPTSGRPQGLTRSGGASTRSSLPSGVTQRNC
jgi:hypothetical protein